MPASSANAVRFTPGSNEDERPGRVHPAAFPSSSNAARPPQDEVQLFLASLELVVLVDDPITDGSELSRR